MVSDPRTMVRLIARHAILAAMIATPTAFARAQQEQPRTRILMIFGHDPNAPGAIRFTQQLKAVVRERIPTGLEIYDEYLDLNRFPDPERSAQLARYFAEKYQGFTPDAIVTAGGQALRFALDRLVGLFPDVPIVYGLAFEPVVDFSSLPANVTGRRLPLPFAATYTLARRLQPDAGRVVLVGGTSTMDSLLLSHALRQIKPLLNGMKLTVWQNWSYGGLIDSLRRLPRGTFALVSSCQRDQRGPEFNTGDLIASLASAASVPMYGVARNWVGERIVGGSVMDFADDGTRTGEILLRVLMRRPHEPMPGPEVAVTRLVVDWRQLQRWSLSEHRLPPGTEVLFRTPSLWERHRGAIMTVLGLLAVESMLIALLLVERRRRSRAQRALERRVAYERMMRALTADMVRQSPADVAGALENALPTVAHVPSVIGGGQLEIPLIAGRVTYGMLKLQGVAMPADTAAQLGAVGDLIAGTLARARDARVLDQTRWQVEHLGRVATVSGLTKAVSHELGQPLTAIRINAQAAALLLSRTAPDVDEARLILQEIIRDDARASEIIEHYRSLLRKQGPISTTVDLNAVCRHTAKLVEQEFAGRGARLVLRLDPDVPPVHGDPVQLQQVLLNLTLNALDASSATPDHEAAGREATIRTAASNGEVAVHVSDTGPGLTPDVQRRLFEPFFSTKPHGLGMGLTIVRSIVEQHHGILRAENRSVGGALFTVTLPASKSSSES